MLILTRPFWAGMKAIVSIALFPARARENLTNYEFVRRDGQAEWSAAQGENAMELPNLL